MRCVVIGSERLDRHVKLQFGPNGAIGENQVVKRREMVSSGAPWERAYGYSRAVRVGDRVFVSGTVGRNADGTKPDGVYAQMKRAIHIIESALGEVGASLEDVVRTRTFVADIEALGEVARAHAEAFASVRPAATLVQVGGLVDGYLVEIEADAIVGN